jgi:phosphinothricin acetyltransferase
VNEHKVRLATPDDARAIAEIYAPIVEATTISFEDVAPTVAQTHARIESILRTFPWLAFEERGEVLGFAYASRHRERSAYRWSVDVTVYVHEAARGRRIGQTLYLALFRILGEQRFHRAFAGIALPNDASIALHRSVGFTPVGVYREVGFKLGAWRDVSWWEREIPSPRTSSANASEEPGEPIPLPHLKRGVVTKAILGRIAG